MKRSTGNILFLLLLAFALRIWSLSVQSIWWDEAFTWQTTSHGFANFWQMLLTGDRNPPLYFATVALWGSVAGWSEFSLRFASVVWSMIGLAFLFNLAKRLYNLSAGLWTLALAAFSPALVVYAQEARMYAAFFALTTATLYFGMRSMDSEASLRGCGNDSSRAVFRAPYFGLFLGCEAALLLTHYFALPVVFAINVCALVMLTLRRAQIAQYAKWVGGQIVAALPIVLWTLIVFTTPGSLIQAREAAPELAAFVLQVVTLWLSGVRDLAGEWLTLALIALVLLPLAALGAGRVNSKNTGWLIGFGLASFAAAYCLTQVLTSFHPRYLLPYNVPWLVLTGGALSLLAADRGSHCIRHRFTIIERLLAGMTLVGAGVLLLNGWQATTSSANAKDDTRGVAAYLRQEATADDVILLEANDYTLNYYHPGPAQSRMITATSEAEGLAQLSKAIGNAKRVWLPHWQISTQDPRGYWPFLLEQSGRLEGRAAFHGYDLFEYEMQAPLHQPAMTSGLTSGPITQYSSLEGQGADGALALALTWQTPVKFFDPARVSVRLIDAYGNTLSARDAALLDEHGRTTDRWEVIVPVTNTYVLPIPPGAPPGTYTITAQLYHERDVLATEVVGSIVLPRRFDTNDPYRTLAGYDWQVPAMMDDFPGLTLDAYAISPQAPAKPQPIDATLRWRKTGETGKSTPRLRLAQADRVWSEIGSNLLERDYPIELWQNGETVIDRLQIDYPPVRGPIEVQIGQGDHWTTLTTLQLDESQLMFNPPVMQQAQAARFGSLAELLGHDLKFASLSSSRPLHLTLYWRALNTEPITTSYTVFTQLLAADGHLVAQHDAPPNPPTTQWVPGQIVLDTHAINLVDPAYRGPATLIVGWYNSASIERVPVQGGGDFVALAVPVRVDD